MSKNKVSAYIGAAVIVCGSIIGCASVQVKPRDVAGKTTRTDAVVLVNSASTDYLDFKHYIKPYLDNFGIPYTALDISKRPVSQSIEEYAVIIIGHRMLDPDGKYLDAAGRSNISAAVSAGTGLVNFDNVLLARNTVGQSDILGLTYVESVTDSDVVFSPLPGKTMHYVITCHDPNQRIKTRPMNLVTVTPPDNAAVLAATAKNRPVIVAMTKNSGRIVHWTTYQWMSNYVKGPVGGLDDLVWRSIVWAARKPFVMQGMPPLLTMRVDDVSGPFDWLDTATGFGLKPWLGLFIRDINETEATHVSSLISSGKVTVAVHSFTNSDFFYYDHCGLINGPWSDKVMAENFAEANNWLRSRNIGISKVLVPHWYEIGANALPGVDKWGVEFLGVHTDIGQPLYAPWIVLRPYRLYEPRQPGSPDYDVIPAYYADFVNVPGHPEFNGRFFNCLTEIRDSAGYEWEPTDDVALTVARGTSQTKRAFDSMILATLFSHEKRIMRATPEHWRQILQGVTTNLATYHPIYVTLDYGCQYVRAMYTSDIKSSFYNPASGQLTATLSGKTDIPTMFYLFTDEGSEIKHVFVNVPAFTGSAIVEYKIR